MNRTKRVVSTVGRFIPPKGYRAALEAFAKMCSEFPDAHYLIVGTGPQEEQIRRQIERLGFHQRMALPGFVPGDRLPDHYRLCDIMLIANHEEADGDIEGFGIVFLEANATAKPEIGGAV